LKLDNCELIDSEYGKMEQNQSEGSNPHRLNFKKNEPTSYQHNIIEENQSERKQEEKILNNDNHEHINLNDTIPLSSVVDIHDKECNRSIKSDSELASSCMIVEGNILSPTELRFISSGKNKRRSTISHEKEPGWFVYEQQFMSKEDPSLIQKTQTDDTNEAKMLTTSVTHETNDETNYRNWVKKGSISISKSEGSNDVDQMNPPLSASTPLECYNDDQSVCVYPQKNDELMIKTKDNIPTERLSLSSRSCSQVRRIVSASPTKNVDEDELMMSLPPPLRTAKGSIGELSGLSGLEKRMLVPLEQLNSKPINASLAINNQALGQLLLRGISAGSGITSDLTSSNESSQVSSKSKDAETTEITSRRNSKPRRRRILSSSRELISLSSKELISLVSTSSESCGTSMLISNNKKQNENYIKIAGGTNQTNPETLDRSKDARRIQEKNDSLIPAPDNNNKFAKIHPETHRPLLSRLRGKKVPSSSRKREKKSSKTIRSLLMY